MSSKIIRPFMLIVIVVVTLLSLTVVYQHHQQKPPAPTLMTSDTGNTQNHPASPLTIDTKNQPTLGSKKAPVSIVAFEDLKCIACRDYNLNLYQTIKKDYVNTGKASYTIMNLAFIPGSINAATTARCLYNQKPDFFFQFVDYIYKHQGAEEDNWTTVPNMLAEASKINGVDNVKLGVCVTTNDYSKLFNQNLEQASKLMGGTIRTPSLYVNGTLVSPLTIKQFKTIYNQVS